MSVNPEAPKETFGGHVKRDTPPEVRRVQYEICRRIPTGRKLELTLSMYDTGRLLALAGLRMLHPEASDADLQRLWARKHLGPELFEQVYGGPQRG
ncbi:MAG: hypothetical protein JW993_13750 [Sedimentisphaerales bacterium]|nr:hypothetical protein [Sedimentisphaerales bacterium]